MLMGVKPGGHGHERCPTKRVADVAACESHSFIGKLVDVGRLNVLMAHEAVMVPCLIVADNQHDVGPLTLAAVCRTLLLRRPGYTGAQHQTQRCQNH
jgi:hypothetical protein